MTPKSPGALPGLLAARLPFFYGWVILGSVCSVGFARQGAAVATLSIFVAPMTAELGWSQAEISGAVALGGLLAGVTSPMLGPLVDRHGARAMLIWSVLAMGLGCALLATVESLALFYVLFCTARMSFTGPFDLGMYGALNSWFVHRRPIATSTLTLWLMIGLTLMPLIAHFAMDLGGDWRVGWLAVGAVVLTLGLLPVLLLLVRSPEDMGLVPDGRNTAVGENGRKPTEWREEPSFSRAEAMRTPAFWALMLFTFLAFPVQAGVSLHQAPYLLERGLTPTDAAFVVSYFSAVSGIVGFGIGPLVRPLGLRPLLLAVGASLGIACLIMLTIDGPATAYLAATFFGAGIGGMLTVPPIAWADTFGRKSFGAIRGVALAFQVIGQALGPILSGILRDQTGDYELSLRVFIGFAAASMLAILFLRPPVRSGTA